MLRSVKTFNALQIHATTLMNSSWRSGDWSGYFGVNPCYHSNCVMYSATEISELIKYGAARGVRMIPFTSAIPRGEFPATLNSSMVPPGVGYKHADWMDEVDGLGPSRANNGTDDAEVDRRKVEGSVGEAPACPRESKGSSPPVYRHILPAVALC